MTCDRCVNRRRRGANVHVRAAGEGLREGVVQCPERKFREAGEIMAKKRKESKESKEVKESKKPSKTFKVKTNVRLVRAEDIIWFVLDPRDRKREWVDGGVGPEGWWLRIKERNSSANKKCFQYKSEAIFKLIS